MSLRVACATESMSSYYKRWFPNLTVIGHEDNIKPIDLLILTGGEDINPSRYRERVNGAYPGSGERDEREFNILREVLRANRAVKVLGVCRGLQLLNVYFGGTLWQDLGSVNLSHKGVHKLVWEHVAEKHPLSWIETVNSLHHQAVRELGYDTEATYILAKEPISEIPEVVLYGRNCLGVQFHPELSDVIGDKFFPIISNWVAGNVDLSIVNREEIAPWDDDESEDEEEEEGGIGDERIEEEDMSDITSIPTEPRVVARTLLHFEINEENAARYREQYGNLMREIRERTQRRQTNG